VFVAFEEERKLRVLVRLVGLGREAGAEVGGGNAFSGEAGYVRPGLLRAYLQVTGDKALQQGMVQSDRPARGELHHLVPRPASGFLEQPVEDALYVI
jgi:hypothetical protein